MDDNIKDICIFSIIGKSSVGKDSILDKLMNLKINVNKIVPFTTRLPRDNETNGYDYIFVDNKYFKDMIDNNLFLDYKKYRVFNNNEYINTYYGYPKPNKKYNIMITPYETYNNLRHNYEYKVIPIYILLDDQKLLYRMITRENQNEVPNYKEMIRRYFSDKEMYPNIDQVIRMHSIEDYGFYVFNDDLEITTRKIYDYITNYIKEDSNKWIVANKT